MGWLEGLLTGYADRHGEIRRENAIKAETAANREAEVYKALLNSEDPTIRGYAATGLIGNTQPRRSKSGFQGWMGEMEQNPAYPVLMKYLQTPQPKTGYEVTTEPGQPSRQTQGYLPPSTVPGLPGQPGVLAQATTSPTEGEPMATPKPLPQDFTVKPPPPPPALAASMADAAPEDISGVNASVAEQLPGEQYPPFALTGVPHVGPPPPPPHVAGGVPSTSATLQTRDVAGPPIPHLTETTRYELPHAFPTQAENYAANEGAKVQGEIRALQTVYREQGDPDWQKKGVDAYLLQHGRGGMTGVVEGDTQQVSGPLARQLGVPDGTWMQPLYDKQTGAVVHWIPGGPKGATGALNLADQAARIIGYNSAREVPNVEMPRFQAAQNALIRDQASNRAGGGAQGRYDADKARIDPKAVDYAARALAADVSLSAAVLNGRPQAFKDAVLSTLASKGVTIEKLDEATRSMASMSKDILTVYPTIVADATALDAAGMMGPISGRWLDFLAGKIGAVDAGAKNDVDAGLFEKFRNETALLQQAVARAHAGVRGAGSPPMLEHMNELLSASHMDLVTFLNGMAGFKPWLETYAQHLPEWGTPGAEPGDLPAAGGGPQAAAPPPTAAPAPAAAPGGLSPQFTAPLKFDPATGKAIP